MAIDLSIANPRPTKRPGPQLLHELIPYRGHGESAAIDFMHEDGHVTKIDYSALHRYASNLAHRLCNRQTRRAFTSQRLVVPLFIEQCPELYISQLAVLKAGGAFCPLALDIPEERLRFILKDVEATILLTTPRLRQQLPSLEGVDIIEIGAVSDETDHTYPDVSISPHDAAYIMYTSGSTGQPKGVIISHSAATQALLAHDRHIPEFSRFLQFASPTFDVSVFEIFFPLFRGRTLVCCDRKQLLNDLPRVINHLQVDAAELTPSVANSLLRNRQNAPCLRVLLTIGEMLKPAVVEEFGGTSDEPAMLHGMYGPTEATIHCTLQTEFGKDMPCGIIGAPLDTVSAFILKPSDGDPESDIEVLPIGQEGELAVGGYQLADGYLNREEQTRAAFVHSQEYGRLYRTGDLATMLPDGRLECRGRISSGQVKLRGQRIELGEIEYAASRAEGIKDVVSEVVSGSLVLFCVRTDSSVSANAVLDVCKKWLPAFMIPGDVVFLESLPYLASGKLDRKGLGASYVASAQTERETSHSNDPKLKIIIHCLSQVLGVEVSESSSLPGLGLDSLSAIRVAAALKRAGFPQLDASDILSSHYVHDIAAQVERFEKSSSRSATNLHNESITLRQTLLSDRLIANDSHEVDDVFYCSPVQAAMLAETSKDPQAYCNWIELRVAKCEDREALRTALGILSHKHCMLRSGFAALHGMRSEYAVVVWKSLKDSQVQQVKTFDHSFRISDESDLLRPCEFQIQSFDDGAHILLKIHHALYDQWSVDVLRADLARLLQGEEIETPTQFRSISDHIFHHHDEAQLDMSLEFWQDHLSGFATTQLPQLTAQTVPPKLQRTEWIDLDVSSCTLKAKSKELGCSSPAVFQAALIYLMSTYIGSSDVTIGSVLSGRNIAVPGIDSIFGPCLNTLPLRIDVSTTSTCHDLLGAVTDLSRMSQKSVHTSLAAIRRAAEVLPGAALFDTLFVWQETTLSDQSSPGSEIQVIDSADQLEFNLVLEVEPLVPWVRVRVTYQQSLISFAQTHILIRQLGQLANELFSSPHSEVDQLASALSSDILSISNPDPVNLATGTNLAQTLADRSRSVRSHTAVNFANDLQHGSSDLLSITYEQLDSRANQVAHALISHGLQPGELIAVSMAKSIELYITILASIKAGAGYLPLVPDTPLSRVISVFKQAGIKLCACDSETAPSYRSGTAATVLDIATLRIDKFSGAMPKVTQSNSRIAYAVFTSGSTGTPKGVAVTVENLHGNLAALAELYQARPGERLLQACSQAFDVSVFEIFFTFYTGMCLCSAPKDDLFHDLEHNIRSLGITHLSLTPTVAALVDPANVPGVRFLVTAGEGVTEKVHRKWAGRGLHQGYGPSETTNICTVNMDMRKDHILGNIGPPLRNTSAFVIAPGQDFQVLPTGAYGEFAFGGQQVFRGYLGLDQLNSEKMLNHPKYGRIYRSGDMGRILYDGSLMISGRRDDQVKVRGNRIELGEITAVIMRDAEVADCATIVLGDNSTDQTLASFWTPQSGTNASSGLVYVPETAAVVGRLFDNLQETLPAYMIPTTVVPVSELPLTTQGKLDKRRLKSFLHRLDDETKRAISRSSLESDDGNSPETELERTIAEGLCETLGITISSISRQTTFFGLGLNSLNAISLAKAIEAKISIHGRINVTSILRNPSVARLARVLEQHSETVSTQNDSLLKGIFPPEFEDSVTARFNEQEKMVESILPCTPLQEVMLSAGTEVRASVYTNITELQVSGDMQRLHACWQEAVNRHAVLRTVFVQASLASHTWAQVVLRRRTLIWDVSSTHETSNGHVDDQHQYTAYSTDVSPQQPFRIRIQGSTMFLHMHHAVYDGISMSNLFTEVSALYKGHKLPPPISFEPFLEQMLLQNRQEAIEFWQNKLDNFYPHALPQAKDAKKWVGAITARLSSSVEELQKFCERSSVTTLSVLQAAWVKTLTCAQDVDDLCFGNVVSGRATAITGIDRLIAPCFNTIPARIRLTGLRTNMDLVKRTHQNNVDTLDWQLTPLRRMQTLSKLPSVHLFDSLILLQPPEAPLDSDIWSFENEQGAMDFPLIIEVAPSERQYHLRIHASHPSLTELVTSDLARAFDQALTSCLRFPSTKLSHFADPSSLKLSGKLKPQRPLLPSEGLNGDDETVSWTKEEKIVREAFANLAGVSESRLGKNTSLYQIGLDSLNAVQVAAQLRKQGFRVDAADVMQHPTPLALSNVLTKDNGASETEESGPDFAEFQDQHRPKLLEKCFDPSMLEALRPCTPAQSGMLSQSIHSMGQLYINHTTYCVPMEYDEGAIRSAWLAVQRKHQILRLGFGTTEDVNFPFAMLLYNSEIGLESLFSQSKETSLDGLEKQVNGNVVKDLSVPPWRVNLLASPRGVNMSLSMHHALYDADSLRVILSDFSRVLKAQDLGHSINIDAALKAALQGATRSENDTERFWRKTLTSSNFIKFPNLTPTVVTHSNLTVTTLTSSVAVAELEKFCRVDGVTIQAAGQAGWGILLAAYLGEPQVVFGTVFSGNSFTSPQKVAFPSITTVPVPCNTSQSSTAVVRDMLDLNTATQPFRSTSLADIQRHAERPGQPLFDTVFVYQKPTNAGKDVFAWELVRETAAVDYTLSLEMETVLDRVCLRLTFDAQVVPANHASLILRQYDTILHNLVNRSASLGGFPRDLLSMLPPLKKTLPAPVNLLHEFVTVAARQNADKPALEFIYQTHTSGNRKKVWTFAELDRRSNQVARYIQQSGIASGSVVAVRMSKSAEASFAFIGILKAGCAFLAMDPDLPTARQVFILEDSKSQLLFVDEGKSSSELSTRQVEFGEKAFEGLAAIALDIYSISSRSTCYVLYTSGTTGTPKGCEITHENAVQAMLSFQRLFSGHWTDDSRWLQFASYWFDVSVLEHFWSWSVGITVVGAPRDLVLGDLAGFLNAAKITHIDLTPSLARLITPQEVPSLRNGVFITGGESLKQEIIDAWGPEKVICNGYGPTEATIGVTMNPFIGTDAKPSNIGPQFANVGSYVLSPGSDEPVLRGGIGELCVSGKLVGKGYLNRPDLNDKAFPFVDRLGERVYRTGDLVRMLADGSFSFIGRKDTQAKLRGQRLEIDEINTVIQASGNAVSEVASLVAKANGGQGELLVSFVALENVTESELRPVITNRAQEIVGEAYTACQNRLPGYMVPTHIIPIPRLPLTVNNKVDSKKLAQLYSDLTPQALQQIKGTKTVSRNNTHAEQKVAQILSRLLSIEESGINARSNIFALGLSSVSAITLVTFLKRSGFQSASVAAIMKNPTLERLTATLTGDSGHDKIEQDAIQQARLSLSAFAQKTRSSIARTLSLKRASIESLSRCTPLQQGLLLESTKSLDRPYFNRFWYEIADIDATRLRKALETIFQSVAVLRTLFVRTEEGYIQVTLQDSKTPLHCISVSEGTFEAVASECKEQWLSRAEEEVLQPFQMLLLQSQRRQVLIFHAHHALYDGTSWDLMIERLHDIYSNNVEVDFGPKFLSALPYGPLIERSDAETFWRDRLRLDEYHALPKLPSNPDLRHSVVKRCLSNVARVESVRRELGISHQALFQAIFGIALHQMYPQVRSYGVVLSGRSIPYESADKIIGPMFNTVPHPLDVRANDTWTSFLQRCHESNASALPFHHTSLRSIRKFCGRHPSDPMFDVLFTFQQDVSKTDAKDGLLTLREEDGAPDYPLAFEVFLGDSGDITVTAAAQRRSVGVEGLERLLEDFTKALDCITEKQSKSISASFDINVEPTSESDYHSDASGPQLNGIDDFEWTQQAMTLRECIADVSGCTQDDISEHTTLFSLGVDSIDAVRLASKLKRRGLLTPVSWILQAQTIPRILDVVDGQDKSVTSDEVTATISKYEQRLQSVSDSLHLGPHIERILPTTPTQEGLVAEMVLSDFQQYYNHDVLMLEQDVDTERLQLAWQTVVDASPILRTSFAQIEDPELDFAFVQVVHKPRKITFENVTLGDLNELETYFDSVTTSVMSTFQSQPLLRLSLAHMSDNRYLVLSLPHAQYDGHSLALIHEDVQRAYEGSYTSRPSYNKAIEMALKASSEEGLSFWRDNLTGVRVAYVDESQDEDNQDAKLHRGEHTCSVSAHEAVTFCRKHGVSMQALAQTAWAVMLAFELQRVDVIYGVVLACRDSEETEQTMFPTMNTLPFTAPLHGTGVQMLKYVQGMINGMRPHQRVPLRKLQSACSDGVENMSPGRGLFDTLFIYQQRPQMTDNQYQPLYESVTGSSSTDYPVAVEVELVGAEILIRAACKSHVKSKKDVEQLLKRFDHVMETLVTSPGDNVVGFQESNRASLCRLPSFHLKAGQVENNYIDQDPAYEGEDETGDESSLAIDIRTILSQVSKVQPQDIHLSTALDALGIDSVSSIKVASMLRKKDIKISVSNVVKARNLRQMIHMVESNSSSGDARNADSKDTIEAAVADLDMALILSHAKIDKKTVEAVIPATPGQIYMLSMWQKTHGQLFYPTFSYHLKTKRSREDVWSAWEDTVECHSVLRTVFTATGVSKMPILQVVLKSLQVGDTTASQPMATLAVSETHDGFNLKLRISHALYDAVSLPIIMQNMLERLGGSQLTDGSTGGFEDFIAMSLDVKAKDASKRFWTSHFSGAQQIVQIPQPKVDGAQRKVDVFKPALVSKCGLLEDFARRNGLTTQAVLFAIYAKTYAEHVEAVNDSGDVSSDVGDVVLGVYLSNRSQLPGLETLVAPTLNLVPLLVRKPGRTELIEVAKAVQRDLRSIGSAENSAVSLCEVEQWTGVRVDTFINFLKLPGRDEDAERRENESQDVISPIDDVRLEARSQVVGAKGGKEYGMIEGLNQFKAPSAYQHSVDVEISISDEGVLDLGVFAPEVMLSLQDAEKLAARLKALLEKLVA